MANNQNGRGVHRTDENRPSWRPQDQDYEERRWARDDRDDDRDRDERDRERYAHGGDEGRWGSRRGDEPARLMSRNWEDDRDEGYRGTERYGQGQSGYGAGRYADDRSQGYMNRNARGGGRQNEDDREGMATDDRWTGRGGQGYWEDRRERRRDFGDDRGSREYNSGYNRGGLGFGGYGQEGMRQNVGSQAGVRGERDERDPRRGEFRGGASYGYGGGGGSGYYGQGHQGQYDQVSRGSYGQGMTGQGGQYGPYSYGGGGPDVGPHGGGQSGGGYGAQGPNQGHTGGYAQGGRGWGAPYDQPGMQNLQGVQGGMPQGGFYGAGHAVHAGHAGQGPSIGVHRGKGPQGYTRSDERIRELVCEALTDDDHVDASNIEVTVEQGEVTLTGTVEDRYAKRMAEGVVERCAGVKDVHNQLRVQGDPRRGPGNQTGNSAVGRTETDTNPTLAPSDRDKDKKHRA